MTFFFYLDISLYIFFIILLLLYYYYISCSIFSTFPLSYVSQNAKTMLLILLIDTQIVTPGSNRPIVNDSSVISRAITKYI